MRDCLLSVAICTFNRANLLDEAFRSFTATAASSDARFELLVVDNNSSDRTGTLVRDRAARSAFPIRYVFEGRQGLSRARNRAIEMAEGAWVWFVDDDVLFSAGWLKAAIEGIASFPGASMLAGRVVPAFEPSLPRWMPSSAFAYYGMTRFGDGPRWLEAGEYPVGVNMAVRRSVLAHVGAFREDVGRSASGLLSSEETDLAARLHKRGMTIGYVPGAEVRHRIREDRATMSWLRRRAFWGGVSSVLIEPPCDRAGRFERLQKAAWTMVLVGSTLVHEGIARDQQIVCAWRLGKTRQYLSEAAQGAQRRIGIVRR